MSELLNRVDVRTERILGNTGQEKKASCVTTFRFGLKMETWSICSAGFPAEEEANDVSVMKSVFWGVLCEYSLWCFL